MTDPRPDRVPRFDPATEAELDAAAEITPEDIARAQEAFRESAPKQFRDLLDAEPEE
jgi:acyl-CoA reductase-like NAD-dependent aldehyde dehydrogenase